VFIPKLARGMQEVYTPYSWRTLSMFIHPNSPEPHGYVNNDIAMVLRKLTALLPHKDVKKSC